MNVRELTEVLKKYDQDLPVAYACYSEFILLEAHDLGVVSACEPRHDGWVARARPDKKAVEYLMFPGN
jgi:hypothetical protein